MIQYGDTQSFSQIYGRKPRRKGYDIRDLYLLLLLFQEYNGWTLHEATAIMVDQTGKPFEDHTIFRMLKEIFHTRKRAAIRAFRCDEVLVNIHYLGLIGITKNRLKFGDESSIDTRNGSVRYGYSRRGEPVVIEDVFVRQYRASVVGVCGVGGMLAHSIKSGSIKRVDFVYFTMFELFGVFEEGDYFILDNATIHKDPIIEIILALIGVLLYYLPPYFPQGNPIEVIWGGMKNKMRSSSLRGISRTDPIRAANIALDDFYNMDLSNLYDQCGYRY